MTTCGTLIETSLWNSSMTDQQKRIELSNSTPKNISNSCIVLAFDGWLHYVVWGLRMPLTIPIMILAELPAVLVVLTLLGLGAISPTHLWGDHAVVAWQLYVAMTLFALGIGAIVHYHLDVLVRVPWRAPRSYPLVRFIDEFKRYEKSIGGRFMIAGGLGMLPTLGSWAMSWIKVLPAARVEAGGWQGLAEPLFGFDTYICVFGLGTYLLFLGIREPAWPFMRFTLEDSALADRMGDEGSGSKSDSEGPGSAPPVAQTPSAQEPQPQPQARTDDYEVPFEPRRARKTFADIHGMQLLKEKLLAPARLVIAPRGQQEAGGRHLEAPRNGILLHGEPGNGKTVFAEALAGELGVPFLEVTYGPLASKWVGQEPATLARTFALARKCAPCVMFIDEIDSFIKSRDGGSSNPEYARTTNVVLTEIVKLREARVVIVGATNYLDQLDAAAVREGRFDFKIEVPPPDEVARIGLLTLGVHKYARNLDVTREQIVSVAKRWNGFSVARLNAVCRALPDVAEKHGYTWLGHAAFMAALREVQGRRGRLPTNTKTLSQMVFDSDTRSALDMIATRLKNVEKIERKGGALPGGILFYGPPGTGKTASARAIAIESGWAFLSVAGPDLLADRNKLTALHREAKDLRPTIIFVDEADEILRNRQYSNHPDMVNKLLSIMDGAEDKVKDLIWIAATNHPENVDAALLRAGRFTEKIRFTAPTKERILAHVEGWLRDRRVVLEHGYPIQALLESLAGQTIANVEGVLQYALNHSIQRNVQSARTVIRQADVNQAIRVVMPLNGQCCP